MSTNNLSPEWYAEPDGVQPDVHGMAEARPGSVISLKLTTEDEVIGKVAAVNLETGAYVLTQPMSLVRADVADDPDKQMVGLEAFMASADGGSKISIDARHVVAACKPGRVMATTYMQKVGAGGANPAPAYF